MILPLTVGAQQNGTQLKIEMDIMLDELKKSVKEGLSEDFQKDGEEELKKLHDKYVKQVDELLAVKNKEIMTV